MKIEMDIQDLESIAARVAERIMPLLNSQSQQDTLFTVEGLSNYLQVTKQWVYEKIHSNSIPHYKMGKYPRFRKSDIDSWLDEQKKGL